MGGQKRWYFCPYVIKYAPKSEVIQMLADILDAIAGSPATEVDSKR
jgi:hypothetical protein